MKEVALGCVVVILFCMLALAGWACSYLGEGAAVIREEVGPRALLKKYEWFKNAAASLDKKTQDVKIYEKRIGDMEADYKDTPKSQWPRDLRSELSLLRSELAGIKSSYNSLAAEYNAQMAKINWRFCNAGDLPEGADRVLPREFRRYVD